MHILFKRLLCLLTLFAFASSQVSPAFAGMISTQQLLADAQLNADRAAVIAALERKEVRKLLAARGIDVEQAKMRVAMLSDEEVNQLALQIDEMPAGGSLLLIGLIVFVALIVTDALGVTDIFTFVK